MTNLEKKHRKFMKPYGQREMRWGVATTVVMVLLMIAMSAGCMPTVVLARFPDGSPKYVKVIGQEHTDYDLIGAGDRTCALIPFCPGWTPPYAHTWHQHGYTTYVGPQGAGYWSSIYWSEWHDFYAYPYYPTSQYNEADHNFLLMVEINSGN